MMQRESANLPGKNKLITTANAVFIDIKRLKLRGKRQEKRD
jgi:hypothetical protein